MKKLGVFIVLSLFLIGFISASGMTASAIENPCTDSDDGKDYSIKGTTQTDLETQTDECAQCTGLCSPKEANCNPTCGAVKEFFCEENEIKSETYVCREGKICEEGACIEKETDEDNNSEEESNQNQERKRVRTLTEAQVQKITTAKNRIRAQNGECPEKCTCTGSVTKCQLTNGTREMTIRAGNSGNTIIQVKGINASTQVTLYKSEDKVYGVFKNNETRELKILPDQVKERIRERVQKRLEEHELELNEDGTYSIQTKKRARLFFLFPVREKVRIEMDSETGEITKIRNPWWGFLAKDEAPPSE